MDPQPSDNVSGWTHRLPVIILALGGMSIAIYLSLFQWQVIDHVWDPVFGTSDQVLTSRISQAVRKVLFLPDGTLGAIAYAVEAFLAAWGGRQRWRRHPFRVLFYGVVAVSLGLAGLTLISLQAFYVQAWCLLCLASAGISFAGVYLAHEEVFASLSGYLSGMSTR